MFASLLNKLQSLLTSGNEIRAQQEGGQLFAPSPPELDLPALERDYGLLCESVLELGLRVPSTKNSSSASANSILTREQFEGYANEILQWSKVVCDELRSESVQADVVMQKSHELVAHMLRLSTAWSRGAEDIRTQSSMNHEVGFSRC